MVSNFVYMKTLVIFRNEYISSSFTAHVWVYIYISISEHCMAYVDRQAETLKYIAYINEGNSGYI